MTKYWNFRGVKTSVTKLAAYLNVSVDEAREFAEAHLRQWKEVQK